MLVAARPNREATAQSAIEIGADQAGA
jgi:hypothetical protein